MIPLAQRSRLLFAAAVILVFVGVIGAIARTGDDVDDKETAAATTTTTVEAPTSSTTASTTTTTPEATTTTVTGSGLGTTGSGSASSRGLAATGGLPPLVVPAGLVLLAAAYVSRRLASR